MDEGFFNKIFSAAAGVWALVAMGAVALFRSWPLIMARLNERRRDVAAEKADDWTRLRQELADTREERDLVRDRWAQCEAEKTELMQENARLNGILQGYGEWKQFQAYRDATRRLVERDSNGGND